MPSERRIATRATTECMPWKSSAWPQRAGRGDRPAGALQGWIRTRRDSKGGFSFLELNDGSCLANMQIVADAQAAELRERDQAALGRLQRDRRRRGEGLAGQRAGDRSARRRSRSSTAGPIPKRIRCRRSGTRSRCCATLAHLRPRTNTFGAVARVRNCICRSIHDFFQEQGFLYVHTPIITASDCEGAGEMFSVTTLDLAKLPKQTAASRLRPGLLRPAGVSSPSAASSKARSTPARSARSTRSARRSAPRTRTPRGTWPSSGWSSPRWRSSSSTDNMDLAEAFLKRIFRDVLSQLPRGHAVLRRAHRQHGAWRRSNGIVDSEFVRLSLHRGGRASWKSRARSSSSRSTGATTCRPSTSAT